MHLEAVPVSIKCKLTDPGPEREPGDMWFNANMVDGPNAAYYLDHYLSDEYKRDWLGKRFPLWVVLPNDDWFCVDSRARNGTVGWSVTGEAPMITCSPSIHVLDVDDAGNDRTRWHGWLQNGELSPA